MMQPFKKIHVIVMDSVGIGEAPDAAKFGDAGAHTLGHIAEKMNIENCYINSYDWRKKVYNSAGFETEDSIGFWHKKIK